MSRFWVDRVTALQPYVPGEQPQFPSLVKLNTNEHALPPPRVQRGGDAFPTARAEVRSRVQHIQDVRFTQEHLDLAKDVIGTERRYGRKLELGFVSLPRQEEASQGRGGDGGQRTERPAR